MDDHGHEHAAPFLHASLPPAKPFPLGHYPPRQQLKKLPHGPDLLLSYYLPVPISVLTPHDLQVSVLALTIHVVVKLPLQSLQLQAF